MTQKNIAVAETLTKIREGFYDDDLATLERWIERRRAKLFEPGDHVKHIAPKYRARGIGTFIKGRAKTAIVEFNDPRSEPVGDPWMDSDCMAVVRLKDLVLLGRAKNNDR